MSKLDPVLICDSCQHLVRVETIHKIGCCDHCGNKRMRGIRILNDEHQAQLKEWGMDDFLAEFEEVADA